MSFFKDFVFNIHPISENSLKEFSALAKRKSLQKNQIIVDLGDIPVNFYILRKGIIRAYIIDEKGKEHTRTIYTPIDTSGNLGALIKKQPSKLIYECLTDCEVVECNYNDFNVLSLKYHDLSVFQYKVLERIYIREEAKILELLMLNSTQRYRKLRNKLPGIDNLINQYHIASFLNITAVQLSRVRKTAFS
ncbi:Crp/Fnr family transcriptional regulator [Tenacibaculum haliotis]|uniref:Crp/Fnr family transcriptional regulator n=1 Tax=Tenacibaculum haliotis TaxID=1888914 RepID=UPI0021AF0BCB|nr:Crp/Fnr family transcriptional regulator [Tenacibaculum haliotis]MCT4698197.1 Crp/Fnr family transcriptional regulator [Tenacibaculum haliotis]